MSIKKISAIKFLQDKGLLDYDCIHFEIKKSDGRVFSLIDLLEEYKEQN